MRNPMVAIFGILIIFFVVLFGVQYGILAIGSTEDGVNMTNNTYEDQYIAAQNTGKTGVAFVQDAPMFIGLVILIISILALMKLKM